MSVWLALSVNFLPQSYKVFPSSSSIPAAVQGNHNSVWLTINQLMLEVMSRVELATRGHHAVPKRCSCVKLFTILILCVFIWVKFNSSIVYPMPFKIIVCFFGNCAFLKIHYQKSGTLMFQCLCTFYKTSGHPFRCLQSFSQFLPENEIGTQITL